MLSRNLIVYEDNCATNKNNYNLFFAHYLVHKLQLFDEVILGFFIPGHSKNECDSDFGTARNWLKKHGSDIFNFE